MKELYEEKLNINKLNLIIKKTIASVNQSKSEMLDIAECAKKECITLEQELQDLKFKVKDYVENVDKIGKELAEYRIKLAEMSKNFNVYTEDQVKVVYEITSQLQIDHAVKREQEQFYIKKRNELEVRMKESYKTAQKADNLVSHIGVILDYLANDLIDVGSQLEDIKQRRNLAFGIIKAQEDERLRVSRDIHDGPAQFMANAVMKAEICEKLFDTDIVKAKNELQNLKHVIRESLQDLRKIIYDLRPMSLDDLGLIPTLNRYIMNFTDQNGINATLKTIGTKDNLKPVISLTVFRIIQEALSNIRKHSKASNAIVNIEFLDKDIRMLIIDDGTGFVASDVNKDCDINSGLGLLSMRERIELLKGSFKLRTGPGKGTRINISLPLDEE